MLKRLAVVAMTGVLAVSTALAVSDPAAFAAADTSYEPLVPARVLDTRTGVGAPATPVGPRGVIELQVTGLGGVPASGVAAVVLNVTAVNPTSRSYLTVWPTGAAQPDTSNLNMVTGQTVANAVIARVGAGGSVSLFNFDGNTDILADVQGWFADDAYEPLVPARILDTRSGVGAPAGPVGPGGVMELQVTGRGDVPASGVSAVMLNVTAVNPTSRSYLTAWPTGAQRPDASNLNMVAGHTVANTVLARVGAGGTVSLFNFDGNTDILADVQGWFADGTYEPLVPARILDTRSDLEARCRLDDGPGVVRLKVTGQGGVPQTGVGAVVLNVTVTRSESTGYVTVSPVGAPRPDASNLNMRAGQTVPNTVVASVGAGGYVELYSSDGAAHLLADVQGWFPGDPAVPGPGPQPLTITSDLPLGDPQREAYRCGILAGMFDGRATIGGPVTAYIYDNRDLLAAKTVELTGWPFDDARSLWNQGEGGAGYGGRNMLFNPSLARERRGVDEAQLFKVGAHEWFHLSQVDSYLRHHPDPAPNASTFDSRPVWLNEAAAEWFAYDVITRNGNPSYRDEVRQIAATFAYPQFSTLAAWATFDGISANLNYEILLTVGDHLVERAGGSHDMLVGFPEARGADPSASFADTFAAVFGFTLADFDASYRIHLDNLHAQATS